MSVRTRFAPSPTGSLHLGNVRAAAFNWLFARRHGGAFVVRIEDTDVERNVAGGEAGILEDLRWLGLDWDEGPDIGGPYAPYRQSERGAHHDAALERLRSAGAAYPCFCSEAGTFAEGDEEGEARAAHRYSGRCRGLSEAEGERRIRAGEPHVLRFRVPRSGGTVEIHDRIFGDISVPLADVDDFVLRRSDGRATYNFAVVADDVDMAISHVIRGVGHLSNTPRQALLFDALGAARPEFAHLPTVLGPDGRKLSKREGAAAVSELRARGYPPQAVLNYLSLLGWSHPDEREVLTPEELVQAISLERVGRSDTQMDPEKLRWISAQHLAQESLEELTARVLPHMDRTRFPQALRRPEAVVDALRTRLSTYGDIDEHLATLFPDPEVAAGARTVLRDAPEARPVLEAVRARLADTHPWDADVLGRAVRAAGAEAGARGAALFHPLRTALIGSESGPDVGKILAATGREDALGRLDAALEGVEARER